ncbi:TPA: hypothetical protein HA273_02820 [Candidatus Bathyarchaeota archaeon]|nr:hypothetical protein [Candidatus Bathyarchaeota archaeon]HIJ08340.1 hypothetical protein [Candidatus Bathyarchaeota archaeon]
MNNTNKNTMYILVAVVAVVIVVAGVAWYVFYYNPGGNGGDTIYTVGNATRLKYDVALTDPDGVTGTYMFAGSNLDTADVMLRVDIEGDGATYSYIMFAGNQTSWANLDGTWVESDFATDWTAWGNQWSAYVTELDNNWSGSGSYNYTDSEGNSVVISDIQVQPDIDDSIFQPI